MENNGGESSNNHDMKRQEEEKEEILKRRIVGHPLYSLLVETHINCLKVGTSENGDENDKRNITKEAKLKNETPTNNGSELDIFMEAYCITLKKLKEAIEEPLEESTCFIKDMHNQLCQMTHNRQKISKPNSSA